jgi:hypothetical protein
MSDPEKDDEKPEIPKPMSRRNFAIGSMAVVGAYSAFAQDVLPPLSDDARALKLEISEDVRKLLDDRHVLEDDIRRVIDHAESTGLKLYQPDTPYLLSKMRIHEAMFYVEYSKDKGSFRIHTAYTHRFKLGEE